MQQDIGRQFHRIVPAEILEVDERQRPVRAAQAVVKAEIGRHQASPFLRAVRRKIKAGGRHAAFARADLAREGRDDDIVQESLQFGLARDRLEPRQPRRDLALDLGPRQAGLGRERLLLGPATGSQRMDRREEHGRVVDIGIGRHRRPPFPRSSSAGETALLVDANHARNRRRCR